ncbi:MAG TPA: hypothetical protein VL688_13020 [Verrucomicrobiae bacterium]|jgi:hypothetical protein|nr:hypothetical protein [Verrucomicrobiae bacterium]
MKGITGMTVIFFLMLVFFGWPAVSYAHDHTAQEIQTLKDGAAALQSTNPELSGRLKEFANAEANERGEEEEDEEADQNVALLNDAAAALQGSNTQLAEALKAYAAKESQEES